MKVKFLKSYNGGCGWQLGYLLRKGQYGRQYKMRILRRMFTIRCVIDRQYVYIVLLPTAVSSQLVSQLPVSLVALPFAAILLYATCR